MAEGRSFESINTGVSPDREVQRTAGQVSADVSGRNDGPKKKSPFAAAFDYAAMYEKLDAISKIMVNTKRKVASRFNQAAVAAGEMVNFDDTLRYLKSVPGKLAVAWEAFPKLLDNQPEMDLAF